MRDVARPFFELLNGDTLDPVELLDVRLVGQNPTQSIRLTNAGVQVQAKSPVDAATYTYLPLPMYRSEVLEKISDGADTTPAVQMTITNVDQRMAALLNSTQFELAEATLWLTDRRLIPTLTIQTRNAVRLTIGQVQDVNLSDTVLNFRIVNVLGQMQRITIPKRIYQEKCNYLFGSTACGANRSGNDNNGRPIQVTTAAQAGSTTNFIVLPANILALAGNPPDPTDHWANGYVWYTDGTAGLQQAPVQRFDVVQGQNRIYFRQPMLVAPTPGDPVKIVRECNKTKTSGGNSCQVLNVLGVGQHGGFLEAPPIRFKPIQIGICAVKNAPDLPPDCK